MPNFQLFLPIIHESTALLYNSLNLPNYINYNSDERDALILNYWGDPDKIQIFPIGFRTIENMFAKSFDHQTVALHVTHIADKAKIEMEWMPVQVKQMGNVQVYDFMLNISDEQHYYFILKKAFYSPELLPNMPATQKTKGMKAATKDNANVLFATIGKYEDNSYCALINTGELIFINGDDGTGGNGYTAGAKIPPPSE